MPDDTEHFPVNVVQQYRHTADAINILFLGDGFADSKHDVGLFLTAVRETSDRLLRNVPPFKFGRIRESINIFEAFTPSLSSGISYLNYVGADGTPVFSRAAPGTGFLEEKPSRFGFRYGYDPGNPREKIVRHLGPKPGAEFLVPEFVRTLIHPREPPDTSAVPSCWEHGNASDGLVIVLVNDDVTGGSRHSVTKDGEEVFRSAVLSLGDESEFRVTSTVGTRDGLPVYDHEPGSRRNRWNILADILAHELGHSYFRLRDEYAEFCDPDAGTMNTGDAVNIQSAAEIASDGIKWNEHLTPEVRAHLAAHGPFPSIPSKPPCPTCTPGVYSTVQFPPRSLYKNRMDQAWRLVGQYEGAGRQHCGVFRPAGGCKMRSDPLVVLSFMPGDPEVVLVPIHFCYVCMLEMVKRLDPAELPKVQALRPVPK